MGMIMGTIMGIMGEVLSGKCRKTIRINRVYDEETLTY